MVTSPAKAAEPGHPPGLVRSDLMAVRLNRRGRLSSPVARSRSDLMSSRKCRASTGGTGLVFSFATPALVGAVHPRSRPPSFAVEELLATFIGGGGSPPSNCGTKGEADFGIAPHFLGFLDPKSHVIWASRSGCDFIQSFYKREGADFDIAPI